MFLIKEPLFPELGAYLLDASTAMLISARGKELSISLWNWTN